MSIRSPFFFGYKRTNPLYITAAVKLLQKNATGDNPTNRNTVLSEQPR